MSDSNEQTPPQIKRSRAITDTVQCPNWRLIKRHDGLSDADMASRYHMLSGHVYKQMMSDTHRKLIPPCHWEEVVLYSIYRAITEWKGNGDGKCPLPHYAFAILRNTSIQYWNHNQRGIIDAVELDKPLMEPD